MCLCDPIQRSLPFHLCDSCAESFDLDLLGPDLFDCPDRYDAFLDLSESLPLPEPLPEEGSIWSLFDRIEADLDWLEAEPREEGALLLRYFGDAAQRIKDVLEYRELLWECLAAIPGSYTVVLLPGLASVFEPDFTA